MKPFMTLTDAAVKRAQYLISQSPSAILGLRVGLKTRGCSGMSYFVEYVTEPKKFEDIVEQDGVKIFIDPPAAINLIGTVMDYQEGDLESNFTFINPNEKARCGCGESFSV